MLWICKLVFWKYNWSNQFLCNDAKDETFLPAVSAWNTHSYLLCQRRAHILTCCVSIEHTFLPAVSASSTRLRTTFCVSVEHTFLPAVSTSSTYSYLLCQRRAHILTCGVSIEHTCLPAVSIKHTLLPAVSMEHTFLPVVSASSTYLRTTFCVSVEHISKNHFLCQCWAHI
jgi:hypothetical protein